VIEVVLTLGDVVLVSVEGVVMVLFGLTNLHDDEYVLEFELILQLDEEQQRSELTNVAAPLRV